MLASDMDNPQFTGAANPNDLLHVEFYMYSSLDANKSAEQGKEVRLPSIPYVRIVRPGDNTSVIETPVRDDHKARFPDKWLAFQMKEGMIEGPQNIPGWKIEEWPVLKGKDTQIHELRHLRFQTVEQLAGASDAQIQRLGLGGISDAVALAASVGGVWLDGLVFQRRGEAAGAPQTSLRLMGGCFQPEQRNELEVIGRLASNLKEDPAFFKGFHAGQLGEITIRETDKQTTYRTFTLTYNSESPR